MVFKDIADYLQNISIKYIIRGKKSTLKIIVNSLRSKDIWISNCDYDTVSRSL